MTDVKLPENLMRLIRVMGHTQEAARPLVLAEIETELLAIHEQGRLSGLEEAAKVCLDQATTVSMHVSSDYALIDHNAISRCVSVIRALAASDGGK